MADSTAIAPRNPPKPVPSNTRRKRDHAEFDTIPASASSSSASSSSKHGNHTTDPIDLTDDADPQSARKQRRIVGSSTIPRTLPMEPHAEVLAELQGKYVVDTLTIISSSKIEKRVTAVLSHLGHVDMFSQTSVPGVVMLHARAGEANKLVTVMELAKRRMAEAGHVWYQYNRVYEVAEERRGGDASKKKNGGTNNHSNKKTADDSQMVIEDTLLEKEEEDEEDEADAFEPTKTLNDLTIRDKPAAESKNAYMSIFLSRVPIPELKAKPSFTLQTNLGQVGNRK